MKCPCYGCEVRSVTCHDVCIAYMEWTAEQKEKQLRERNSSEHDINAYEISRYYKHKRKKNNYR